MFWSEVRSRVRKFCTFQWWYNPYKNVLLGPYDKQWETVISVFFCHGFLYVIPMGMITPMGGKNRENLMGNFCTRI